MTLLQESFDEDDGPLVDVHIGMSFARAAKIRETLRPVPPSVAAKALIDTGAQMTFVDSSVLKPLSLKPDVIAIGNIPATGGLQPVLQYAASLVILHPSGESRNNLVVRNIVVAEAKLNVLGYQVLIGRDILRMCWFNYDGPEKVFRLTYWTAH